MEPEASGVGRGSATRLEAASRVGSPTKVVSLDGEEELQPRVSKDPVRVAVLGALLFAAVLAAGISHGPFRYNGPVGAMEHGEDDCRARIRGGGEEPAGGIGYAAGEGVDSDGGPEGLAGEAAHEVREGSPGPRTCA